MQTQSHFLMTALLRDRVQKQTNAEPGRSLLLGSFLPDVPLLLLTLGYFISVRSADQMPPQQMFGPAYDALYFENPFWIASHSLMHAPLMIVLYGAVGYWGRRRGHRWGDWLLWFAAGCGFHSLVDIFTHVNDGPALLFPFDWHYRFRAPVSYWDPRYGGGLFSRFEMALDGGIILYFVTKWWRNWSGQRSR